MNEPVKIPSAHAEMFLAELFRRAGAEEDTAREVAAGLVEAELQGVASHGLLQAPVYLRRMRAGTISSAAKMREVSRSGAVAVFDAGLILGHAAAGQAAEIVADAARNFGIGAVAVRAATHFGVAGRYAVRLAEEGLVGVIMCNTRPMLPAPGGRQAVAGNNPLAIAVPCAGREPVVFDMAMSAVAMGRLRLAAQKGEPIPPDWALDADGKATTDPVAAIGGLLLPAAGAKGFGLALMVDFLCALGGGSAGSELRSMYADPADPADCSWLFLALDPRCFGPVGAYPQRVAQLAAAVTEAGATLPGDRKRAAMAAAQGCLFVPKTVANQLDAIAQELGADMRTQP